MNDVQLGPPVPARSPSADLWCRCALRRRRRSRRGGRRGWRRGLRRGRLRAHRSLEPSCEDWEADGQRTDIYTMDCFAHVDSKDQRRRDQYRRNLEQENERRRIARTRTAEEVDGTQEPSPIKGYVLRTRA